MVLGTKRRDGAVTRRPVAWGEVPGARAAHLARAVELPCAFFDGFHRCVPALAAAGNNLIVEHIVETETWLSDLVRLLAPFDVFFVGVHCPLAELEARERRRGDRRTGEARNDFPTVHVNRSYDFEVDGTQDAGVNADSVIAAWRAAAARRVRTAADQRGLRRHVGGRRDKNHGWISEADV